MTAITMGYKNIPGTEVKGVFFVQTPEKEKTDIFFVYISKFPDGSNVLELKPASLINPESYQKGRAILENAFAACIEKDADGIKLKVYQAFKDKFSKFATLKISVSTDDGMVTLGSVKSKDILLQSEEKQKEVNGLYFEYLKDAKAQLQEAQKKVVVQKNTNSH